METGTDWTAGLEEIARRETRRNASRNEFYDKVAREAFRLFAFPDGKLIDVGCGGGWARRWVPQAEYRGIDPLAPSEPDLIVGVGEAIPYEDGAFTEALCYSVLQHVEEPEKVLREIDRVLAPGGVVGLLLCIDCADPLFLHHWNLEGAMAFFSRVFDVERFVLLPGCYPEDGFYLIARGRKK